MLEILGAGSPGFVKKNVIGSALGVRTLAFFARLTQNTGMGIDAASNAILSAVTSSSTGAQIGIDLLKSTESNQAQNIATLFSSIGIGGNVSALA